MRIALVHDWLIAQRGGEHVLLELARMSPYAPIYTLVHQPGSVHPEIEQHPIHTSFIQNLPGAPKRFRPYLPLFPRAAEAWDLSAYDAIVSTSHCVAKGVKLRKNQVHVSYVHTPMRYLWDQMPQYLPPWSNNRVTVQIATWATSALRRWDVSSAQRPTHLIANSHYVAKRIQRVWGREASVVHPPVDVDYFGSQIERPRTGYLVVSALVPYKRVDLAVECATRFTLPLTVIGHGSELARLQRMAGPTVKFAQATTREQLRAAYAQARALLFCGVEDFGIVPVEAMAARCPVIALGEGGACESVVGDVTGVFFGEPTAAALKDAIDRCEQLHQSGALQAGTLQQHAHTFHRDRFVAQMQQHFNAAGIRA